MNAVVRVRKSSVVDDPTILALKVQYFSTPVIGLRQHEFSGITLASTPFDCNFDKNLPPSQSKEKAKY